jgi:hypothetical protein
MLGFRLHIWYSVKHNGEFVVNNGRTEIVHARNECEAKSKAVLAPAKHQIIGNLTIDCSPEFIYEAEKIGTVKTITRKFYQYSNGFEREVV